MIREVTICYESETEINTWNPRGWSIFSVSWKNRREGDVTGKYIPGNDDEERVFANLDLYFADILEGMEYVQLGDARPINARTKTFKVVHIPGMSRFTKRKPCHLGETLNRHLGIR